MNSKSEPVIDPDAEVLASELVFLHDTKRIIFKKPRILTLKICDPDSRSPGVNLAEFETG